MVLALCLNGFQVIERTQFYESAGEIAQIHVVSRVMVLALCMSSNVD